MSVGFENRGDPQQKASAPASGEAPDIETLKEDVSQLAEAAVERGRHFMDSARVQATDYVDKRKGDVAQSVADLAISLREATQPFEDRPNIRAFADSAAEGLDQLADSIRERSFGEMYAQIESVMRRRPATIAAVTATAGFMLARFIRASSENVQHGRSANVQHGRSAGRPRDAYNPYVGPGVRRVQDEG